MDFLTSEFIKQYCRIEDYSDDEEKQKEIDDFIEKCGTLGEGEVYKEIGKDYSDMIDEYGKLPDTIIYAAAIATSDLFNHRNPRENNAFKLMLAPFKKEKTVSKICTTNSVNHPKHYNSHPSGVECIDIARHYCFDIGNAIKYLWRAGLKSEQGIEDKEKEIQDLEKAMWYINDRIKQLKERD